MTWETVVIVGIVAVLILAGAVMYYHASMQEAHASILDRLAGDFGL